MTDISCDVHGSIEFLERTCTIEQPFYQYDPSTGKEVTTGDGVTVMSVDILPTELPRESSQYFGDALVGVVDYLISTKQQQEAGTSGIDTKLLPPYLVCGSSNIVQGSVGALV